MFQPENSAELQPITWPDNANQAATSTSARLHPPAAKTSLREHLSVRLQEQVAQADVGVSDYLLGKLDDDGYLNCTIQEAADRCQAAPERVERVLALLQAQGPVGVGARDMRECLLIQVRFWEAQGVHQPYAHDIIESYLSELSEQKYNLIARALHISPQRVKEAHTFIQKTLNPFPTSNWAITM